MKIAPPSPAAITAGITEISARRGFVVAATEKQTSAQEFVTYDSDMLAVLRNAELLAEYKFPVLILGESGTGKELLARVLHGNRNTIASISARMKLDLFYAINCSGIPETLFESLLFGHKSGSFTGAEGDELGLLRAAHNGTAFLDEVGDLPPSQQTKLLRVIQTGRVRPVGDTTEYPINCRFVFATNKDLKAMTLKGTFREDLYYRISTFVLRTKPLRDRECDVKPIAARIAQRHKLTPLDDRVAIPPAAYDRGNVRSLENWMLRRELLGLSDDEALIDL